jgi:acyl-CoA thioesterase FadM
MFPFGRLALELWLARRAPPLAVGGTHVSHHRCWPWDLDAFGELNNGRTLTLADLGRLPFGVRTGLVALLRRQGWRLTMAGSSVRYRRRITAFQRLELRTGCAGRDARFFYIDQSFWRNGEAVTSFLFRAAIVGPDGIVPTDRVMDGLGQPDWNPPLPGWIRDWSAADNAQPWPPRTGQASIAETSPGEPDAPA